MKTGKDRGGLVMVVISTLLFTATFGLMAWLWYATAYLPFLLSGILLLLLSSLNLCFLIFYKDIPLKAKAAEPENDGDGDADTPRGARAVLGKCALAVWRVLKSIPRLLATLYNRNRAIVALIVTLLVFALCQLYFAFSMIKPVGASTLSYWQPVLIAFFLVLTVIVDKWCKHAEGDGDFAKAILRNVRTMAYVAKLLLVLTAVSSVVYIIGYTPFVKYLVYVICAVFYYVSAFALLSVAVLFIKRQLDKSPALLVPLPFAGADASELGVLAFLEENTGITMRSLWSIKFAKQAIPYMVIAVACLLWFSTGIVQVESHQEGAVYRLGKLQNETLEPGLHVTLPYPIDKVELYDTERVDKITIGYSSEEDLDNIWTSAHGENEYRLLLGSGDELVSMNLRIEYKIGDLVTYLTSSSAPVHMLESQAYRLVTDETIYTDLATLLSVDRAVFSNRFAAALTRKLEVLGTGLEVVSVVLESIHPPVEVADIYQASISAEIDAERIIIEAEGTAAKTIANAETVRDSNVNSAYGLQYEFIAEAQAEVAEFMAAVEAYDTHRDAYVFHKYLEAIYTVYGGSDFIIVGEGIDSSNIYFGSTGSSVWQ